MTPARFFTHLSHCTHNKQASQIEDDNEYRCFKAYRKDPRRNTYVYNIEERTTKQLFHHSVLPGYLSWWGISTIEWYRSGEYGGSETLEIVSALAHGDDMQQMKLFMFHHIFNSVVTKQTVYMVAIASPVLSKT